MTIALFTFLLIAVPFALFVALGRVSARWTDAVAEGDANSVRRIERQAGLVKFSLILSAVLGIAAVVYVVADNPSPGMILWGTAASMCPLTVLLVAYVIKSLDG